MEFICKRCEESIKEDEVKHQLSQWGEMKVTFDLKGKVKIVESVQIMCSECGNENFHIKM